MPRTVENLTARWREDGLLAILLDQDGSWLAHLRVEQWYEDQAREPALAWIVSWLDADLTEPTMLSAAIETPALTADDPARREDLIRRALDAINSPPPKTPAPFATPAPTPGNAVEWSEHLDKQIASWQIAFGELEGAANDDGPAGELARYRTLTQTLDWVYAIDSSLTVLWRQLPAAVREQRSRQTDVAAQKAAQHNATVSGAFDVDTDPAFTAYVRRQSDHQPYPQWSEVLLAGLFQSEFFFAISWVRGQLIHAATSAPMDLRQFRPGAQPRWKWRESEHFARGRPNEPGRRAYERVLEGHDVIGLLNHLIDVFAKADRDLCSLI